MKLAYVTTFDAKSLAIRNNWSGIGYYIAQSLKNQCMTVEYMGPLKDPVNLQVIRKLKSRYYKLFHQKNYQKDADPLILKNYASQVAKKLNSIKSDIVFSATVNSIAYLECMQPIVFWADGTFANIQNFYPLYSNLPKEVIKDWHRMEELAIHKSDLAIYSSDWAAKSAIHDYGADPAKVKVVPFGANIASELTFEMVKKAIESRPTDCCKLLFLSVDWVRKGGDVAYQIAQKLNQSGLKTELTIVGCQPVVNAPLPKFVKSFGFINKSTIEGEKQIQDLISESHFLILPTLADCTPIVLAEANSLGVPCLSTTVGGVPSIIHNDMNGRLFDKDANFDEYCDYITDIFADYSKYKDLALSAFNEYESRLNWKIAGQTIKELLMTII